MADNPENIVISQENRAQLQYLLGINRILDRLATIADVYIPAAIQHQKVFPKYKGCHKGEKIVIVGGGPSANFFTPFSDAIYIAQNYQIYRDDIKWKYFFSGDWAGGKEKKLFDFVYENRKDVVKFYDYNCIFFCGDNIVPEYYREQDNVESFFHDLYNYTLRGWDQITRDGISELEYDYKFFANPRLDLAPIHNFGTMFHTAFQFALWTHPKEIYLVGADCSNVGHAKGIGYEDIDKEQPQDLIYSWYIPAWKKLAEFARTYYPDIDVISINPVGLRGVFKDAYTQSYLDSIQQEQSQNEEEKA
ncbi:MAG: hypothetical protein J6O04_09525 [Selenomonadaceae bacterium]|nr:hypothetical protein [Selenomonadaceae bacterium]